MPDVNDLGKAVEAGLAAEPEQNAIPSTTLTPGHSETATQVEFTSRHDHGKEGSITRSPSHISGEDKEERGDHLTARKEEDSGNLEGLRLYLVFLSMMMGVLLFALDQSIVATAIPVIVSDFNAFAEVSWIITGYFLSQCGLILLVGQLLTVIRAKWMLLGAFFFFELGSLLCGVAQSMPLLIFGRAVQGIGTAGMFVSVLAIIVVVVKVDKRPAFMASFGFVFVISSVVGPLLGGVFTDHATWRWCFYINLPVGGVAAACVFFLLPSREPAKDEELKGLTILQKLRRVDYLGAALILVIVTCLLLALQWGGNDYAWGNWRIIFLFVLGAVMIPVFGEWNYIRKSKGLIPMAILTNRTVVAGSIALFMLMLAMLGGTYQLPLYYEAVKNHSPTKAGIDIIPFMLAVCIGIFVSGGATQATGRYWPWILAGPPFSAVGFGLLYTIKADTANAKVIGFQILAGWGVGLSFQNVMLAVQAEFHDRPNLIPQATGVLSFFQLTGAALGIGIVNTVQSIYLNQALRSKAPNVDFDLVRSSVTAIYTLPADQQAPVIEAYVTAITRSFLPIFIAISISFVAAVFIRNHNLKEKGGGGAAMA